jgi:ElaB/YqjD/DUF883 family membrane-anchored ribosome-binding protein
MADAKNRVKDAVDEGATKAKDTSNTLAATAGEVMSDVRDYAGHVLEQSRQGFGQVADHAQTAVRQAGEVVRGNPGLSLSAVFGVGIALGVVIGISWRRPSRRNDFLSHLRRPGWLS